MHVRVYFYKNRIYFCRQGKKTERYAYVVRLHRLNKKKHHKPKFSAFLVQRFLHVSHARASRLFTGRINITGDYFFPRVGFDDVPSVVEVADCKILTFGFIYSKCNYVLFSEAYIYSTRSMVW